MIKSNKTLKSHYFHINVNPPLDVATCRERETEKEGRERTRRDVSSDQRCRSTGNLISRKKGPYQNSIWSWHFDVRTGHRQHRTPRLVNCERGARALCPPH
ncbi:hypothetical protein BaRGS_00034351 [Batillaria attramentaria]|uniref:Uncharacterized protein n=1 Tax=Batillaria attramentaria TaxID=370345 RepID=A0ABD0JHD4_9CAEN